MGRTMEADVGIWTDIVEQCTHRPASVNRDELRRQLALGIEPQHRAQVWLAVSGAAARCHRSGGLYPSLLERLSKEKPHLSDDIDRDIPRAFPMDTEFNTEHNLEKLRRVLYAFCLWHPSVYYCQS